MYHSRVKRRQGGQGGQEPVKPISWFWKSPEYKEIVERVIKLDKNYTFFEDFTNYESLDYALRKLPTIQSAIHVGQLKLMLTEIEFLTEFLTDRNEIAAMLYAGSAPCHHLYTIMEMFPNMTFILVDPNPHIIKFRASELLSHFNSNLGDQILYFRTGSAIPPEGRGREINIWDFGRNEVIRRSRNISGHVDSRYISTKDGIFSGNMKYANQMVDVIENLGGPFPGKFRIFIVEDYFTVEMAKAFAGKNVLFCSDIRTNTSQNPDKEDAPTDLDILWNSAQQYIWLNEMQPRACMLKFRPPYMIDKITEIPGYVKADIDRAAQMGLDLVTNYMAGKFIYIKAKHIYIQAFPGRSSTESRLICTDYKAMQAYDNYEWENKYLWYNKFVRQLVYYGNVHMHNQAMGIDGCADCNLMIRIFRDYFKKFGIDPGTDEQCIFDAIIRSLRNMGRNLHVIDYYHGRRTRQFKTYADAMFDPVFYADAPIDGVPQELRPPGVRVDQFGHVVHEKS